MATVTVCFTMDSDRDRDLVRWMDGLTKGKRSWSIREVLRKGLGPGHGSVTLSDVYQVVKGLERRLQAGAVVTSPSSPDEWDEPPEAAAALESLARL